MTPITDTSNLFKSKLIQGIAHVELRVTDISRALEFYRDVVGLEVLQQDPTSARLGSGGTTVLVLDSEGVTLPADSGATGLFHTAIRFPTRATLGDALARLVTAGLAIGAGDHLVSEALYIDDPDGNGVELYWDRPVDQWPPPANGMLIPMATLPVDLQDLLDNRSEAPAVGQPAPDGTDIGHVHLQVSDIGETHRFYGEVLGLDVTANLGDSAGFFSSNGYHHNIGANTWRSRGGAPARRDQAGLQRVVFTASDATELKVLQDRIPADSVVESSENAILIRDPDGIDLRFEL